MPSCDLGTLVQDPHYYSCDVAADNHGVSISVDTWYFTTENLGL